MSDDNSTRPVKARTVALLKVTGRNKEGEEPKSIGETILAVFADCSEAGSAGGLESTDPNVLRALADGYIGLDDALAELPTGTRDELCIRALTEALGDIEELHAKTRAPLTVAQIRAG